MKISDGYYRWLLSFLAGELFSWHIAGDLVGYSVSDSVGGFIYGSMDDFVDNSTGNLIAISVGALSFSALRLIFISKSLYQFQNKKIEWFRLIETSLEIKITFQ